MALSSTETRKSFSGDGLTTAFSFPYYFYADTDLKVRTVEVSTGAESVKVLNTDYTVTGAGETSGGTVTFGTAPASGFVVIIDRDPSPTQVVSLSSTGPFPAETLEKDGLNRMATILQWLKWFSARTLRLPPKYTGAFSGELPVDDLEADGRALLASTTGLSMGPTSDEISNAQSYAEAAEDAKDAALLAQTNAETAETNAETAESNAEAAQLAAEQAQLAAEAAAESIVSNKTVDVFVIDDDTTNELTATVAPGSINNSDVTVGNVPQLKDGSAYTVAGNVYTFAENLPNGEKVQIVTGGPISIGVPGDQTVGKPQLTIDALYKSVVTHTDSSSILLTTDVALGNVSGGAITLTLPSASLLTGKILRIMRLPDATTNILTLSPYGSETVDGVAENITLSLDGEYLVIFSDGSGWVSIEHSLPRPKYAISTNDIDDTVTGSSKAIFTNAEVSFPCRKGRPLEISLISNGDPGFAASSMITIENTQANDAQSTVFLIDNSNPGSPVDLDRIYLGINLTEAASVYAAPKLYLNPEAVKFTYVPASSGVVDFAIAAAADGGIDPTSISIANCKLMVRELI